MDRALPSRSVILAIFNRGSSVFAFPSIREEHDTGFPIRSPMKNAGDRRRE
jgi:hypothetical protein